jgi:MYXO-CTERM domain-containing protein
MPKATTVRCIRSLAVLLPLALGAGCTGTPTQFAGMGEPPPGAVRGELETTVATYDNGTTDSTYVLHLADGGVLPLVFDSEPDVAGNSMLDVWGKMEKEHLRVTRFEVLPADRIVRALISGPPYAARSFAFVIVDTAMPATRLLQADAERRLFGITPNVVPSLRQYYVEASYGRQDISAQVFGPFSLPMTGCNTNAVATTLASMVPATFDHYMWYMEPRNPACSSVAANGQAVQWLGLAQSGSAARPSKNTWYNNSSACVVIVQEPGHNFGMQHSSAMTCRGPAGNVSFLDDPNGPACVHDEYGDRFDPMGQGCRHMNAFQKAYQGWFDRCNLVDTPVETTINLMPLELPCDGVQAITVPFPHTRMFMRSGGGGGATVDALTNYLVEMRAPIGIDTGLAATVQIRAAGDLRLRTERGLHTWILDMNPATPGYDGLGAGQTFTDPTGSPRITVMTLDNTHATVRVEFPTPIVSANTVPTCLDNTPFTGPGPGVESCAPAVASASGALPATPDGGATPPPPVGGNRRDAGADSAPTPAADARSSSDTSSGAGGAGGTGGGGTMMGAGGRGPSADASSTGPVTVVSGGCGCRLGGAEHGPNGGAVAFGLALMALIVRRRRAGR